MTTKIPVELSSTPSIVDNGDATAITITSSENVGIGETSPLGKLHVKTADSGASADSGADELVLENSGDAGITILSGTSNSGSIRFGDSDDNDNGIIIYNHDSSPYLRFFTGGSVRARLDSDGLKFGSDTAAANALDDYEEGTWSPVFTATGLSATHDISNGYYTKIGNHVFFSMLIGTSAVSGASSYQLTLTGLPYTSLNSTISMSSGSVGLAYKFANNENGIKWFIGANTAYLRFYDGGSNTGAIAESNHLSTATASNRMYIIGHYITA